MKGVKLQENAETAIVCKKCVIDPPRMVVKTNRKKGTQFLGCPNWPECDYTEHIPESMYMQAIGQPLLF